jgi:hypothetical protein
LASLRAERTDLTKLKEENARLDRECRGVRLHAAMRDEDIAVLNRVVEVRDQQIAALERQVADAKTDVQKYIKVDPL